MQHFYDKTKFVEPKSTATPTHQQSMTLNDQELLLLTGLSQTVTSQDTNDIDGIIRGKRRLLGPRTDGNSLVTFWLIQITSNTFT